MGEPVQITPQERVEAFARGMGWKLKGDGAPYIFDGWLELWAPESQCYVGQTGWLACYVHTTPGCFYTRTGDPGYPPETDSVDIGEYADLTRALAELVGHWLEDQHSNEAFNAQIERDPLSPPALGEGEE